MRVSARALVKPAAGLGAGVLGVGVLGVAGPVAPAASASVSAASSARVARPYDFTGNGHQEIAIGSPYGRVGSKKSAGYVTVADPRNLKKRQIVTLGSWTQAGAHFGYSLTSIDLAHRGYADLIVGAPDFTSGKRKHVGLITIFWGGPHGLSPRGTTLSLAGFNAGDRVGLSVAAGTFNGTPFPTIAGSGATGWFWGVGPGPVTHALIGAGGYSLRRMPAPSASRSAAPPHTVTASVTGGGDITGEGHDNVVLTWSDPKASDPRNRSVIVVYDPQGPDVLVPKSSTIAPTGPVAVGDFNGDGHADVAIGNPAGGPSRAGQVTVYWGSSTGISTAKSVQLTLAKGAAGDGFGTSVAAGDLNGDGKADLVVGAPYRSLNGHKRRTGEAVVFYGSASGLNGGTALTHNHPRAGDQFGYAVSALDTGHSGHADLIASAPWTLGGGSVTVFKGGAKGVTTAGAITFWATTLGQKTWNAILGYRLGH